MNCQHFNDNDSEFDRIKDHLGPMADAYEGSDIPGMRDLAKPLGAIDRAIDVYDVAINPSYNTVAKVVTLIFAKMRAL